MLLSLSHSRPPTIFRHQIRHTYSPYTFWIWVKKSTSITLVLCINKYLELRYWNWYWDRKSWINASKFYTKPQIQLTLCALCWHARNSAKPWKYCIWLHNEQPHTLTFENRYMIVKYGSILPCPPPLFLFQYKYTQCSVWLEKGKMSRESVGMLLGRFGNWDASPLCSASRVDKLIWLWNHCNIIWGLRFVAANTARRL